MKKQLIGILAVTLLSGCGMSIRSFDRSDYSFARNNKSELVLVSEHALQGNSSGKEFLPPLLEAIPENVKDLCEIQGIHGVQEKIELVAGLPEAALSLIPSAGKFIVDFYLDRKADRMEELKQAAQAEYSNRIITAPGVFNNASCAIIYRYNEEDEEPVHFVSVLQLQHYGDSAFVLKPVYVKADNTVAITKKPDEGKTAKIDTSFTVSLKAIRPDAATRLPALSRIGEGVVSVANVDVGPEGKASCLEECESSDLIALPRKYEGVSATFVTSELGRTGMNLDKRAAQVKALKEALGPILESELEDLVKKEE